MNSKEMFHSKLPGTLVVDKENIHIIKFALMPDEAKRDIEQYLSADHLESFTSGNDAVVVIADRSGKSAEVAGRVGRILSSAGIRPSNKRAKYLKEHKGGGCLVARSKVSDVIKEAADFAAIVRQRGRSLLECLCRFETAETAWDEMRRTIDLFDSLGENHQYFGYEMNSLATYLPRNQPLYSLACFALVPSYQARTVSVRPATCAATVVAELFRILELPQRFGGVRLANEPRSVFAKTVSEADAVIFTGRYENAVAVTSHMKPDALLVFNGSGHNPIVVAEDAMIEVAAAAIVHGCMYNQGEDCAAPNAILVHDSVVRVLLAAIVKRLDRYSAKVGDTSDSSVLIGHNHDVGQVLKVVDFLSRKADFIRYGGLVKPSSRHIWPAVVVEPLSRGGNYAECFAPIVMLQPYGSEDELRSYFVHDSYRPHAMYLTVFGEVPLTAELKWLGLHDDASILRNVTIHEVERGVLEYGGRGRKASGVFHRGVWEARATLPQREIFELAIRPVLERRGAGNEQQESGDVK
jgi:Aldehyde dehydrogenase family